MSKPMFNGTGVAIVTPFRSDGSIDFKSFESHINFLIENQINYIIILGTTGESATLSKDEKSAIIEAAAETINHRVPLVVGIGGNNTCEVEGAIKQANMSFIDGILSVAPYYNKPSQLGLFEHYKAIASASPKPVILYNVPGRTASNLNADTVLKLATDFKNVVAVKEASGNFEQLMEIIQNKPAGFEVISGDDLTALPIISLGGIGVISVIANAFPKKFTEMVSLGLKYKFKEAQQIHYTLFSILRMLFVEGNPAGIKAILSNMKMMQNCLRLPLTPVSKSLYTKIGEEVKFLNGIM